MTKKNPPILSLLMATVFLHAAAAAPAGAQPAVTPSVLAHRGIAQRFDTANLAHETCTARRIHPPQHDYLENTIPSMRAAFAAGADVVEIDVHPTTDGQFAVFHDWTLDCRTEGTGPTRERSMAELKRLDIGYGYTADDGRTFPFRGKGVGLMPSLAEVLAAFPGHRFLLNVKSNDADEGAKFAAYLAGLAPAQRDLLMVYGGDRPLAEIRRRMPALVSMSRQSLKSCLLRYLAYGWTGVVPDACARQLVLVPLDIAPWLWGWPQRFVARMASVGSPVYIVGPYAGGGAMTGIDTAEQLAQIPPGYAGGILTDELPTIRALLARPGAGGAAQGGEPERQ
ncbi:glycerophosphodiester phosphodiesterase [Cupriavidus respiraculi]|uniref:glycerophosphodiester phosphodiesterase family protein n=1 Tax=Cupriavidus respiraculi TaxID=195930 RepID=UPI001C9459C2|nr:glycerophosphodiester phosphodiesterase family protein [Cupriavidus respiraculi]MBY4948187.1 glycerophosphodiester phosphodiesterase [Cupriavidus respiraculi]